MAPPTPVPIVIKTISVGRRRNLTHQISENLQSIKLRTYFSASKESHHYIYSWSSTWENSRMSYLCSLWPCASTLESLPRTSLVPNLSHKGSQHASYQQLLLSTPVIQRFMIDILWHIPVLDLDLQAFPNPSRHLLTSKCEMWWVRRQCNNSRPRFSQLHQTCHHSINWLPENSTSVHWCMVLRTSASKAALVSFSKVTLEDSQPNSFANT